MEDGLFVREVTVGLLGTCCYIVGLAGRDDCVVIDPGAEPERIRQATEGRRIAAIVLTHGHFDHTGAVEALMDADTALVIHRLDAAMLSDPETNVSWMIGQQLTAPEATITVREGDRLTLAGVTFHVLHTPGHTPGSACYQAGNHLFTGDTMFQHGYGRTDLPGGSDAEMGRSLQRLAPLVHQCAIHPGHGG